MKIGNRVPMMASALVGAALFGTLSVAAGCGTALAANAATRPAHSTQPIPAALRPAFYKALAKDAGGAYAVNDKGCATLPNRKLKACFDEAGAHFTGAGSPLALHLTAWGRAGDLQTVKAVNPAFKGNDVRYAHRNLAEWWRVLPMGFEQGFTIGKRPSGNGELTLVLTTMPMRTPVGAAVPAAKVSLANLPTPIRSRDGRSHNTSRHSRVGGNPVKKGIPTEGRDAKSDWMPASAGMTKETVRWGKLRYGKLVVTDAKGKVVPATLKSEGDRILIAVNDAHAAYPLTVDPLVWLSQKVTASDGTYGDAFGYPVALSGNAALIGAEDANFNGQSTAGAAYVFSYANGKWTQTAKLTASDPTGNAHFGSAVALDGSTALVGAYNGGNNSQGAAYVFKEAGGVWSQTAELTLPDSTIYNGFGEVVALNAATAVDAATAFVQGYNTTNATGTVFVFAGSNGVWTQTQKLSEGGGSFNSFGYAIALDGTTALIGDYNATVHGNTAQGAAYVYNESNGVWALTQELAPSDGAKNTRFGTGVALDGGTALVGADEIETSTGAGAAYVFTESGGTWTQVQKLTARDGAAGDAFGTSVALDGSTALVGAPYAASAGFYASGAAYMFTDSNGTWTQTAKLTSNDPVDLGDHLGISVALNGTAALAGTLAGNDVAIFFSRSDLGLAVSVPSSVGQGEIYVNNTIATNNGTAATPLGVSATISVPAGATFVTANVTQGSCSEGTDPYSRTGVITCDFGSILGNAGTAKASVTFEATGNKGDTIENSARVSNASPALTASGATVIGNANQPPVAKNGTLTTKENAPASGTLEASDADGDALTYSIVAKPAHGTVKLDDASKGSYTYTPAKNYSGKDSFTFKANDGTADSNTATISIAVTAGSSGSTTTVSTPAGPVTFTTSDGKIAVSTASKPDGAPSKYDYPAGWFSFQITGLAPGATVTLTLKLPAAIAPIAYVECMKNATCSELGAQFNGNTVTLKLTDGGAGDTDGTADGVITDPGAPAVAQSSNQPPVASDGALAVNENGSAGGTLVATDADGDALTFSIVSQPSHGSVRLDDASTGAYTYTPTSDYSGSDSFTFKANDGKADSNVARIAVTVNKTSGGSTTGSGGGAFGGLGLGLLALIGLAALIRRRR